MQKIKLNDQVIVIAGKNKGKTGKVTYLSIEKSVVKVSGVNLVKKALKPTQENPNGGIVEKEAVINISNIALLSPKNNKPSRVRINNIDGKNKRVLVACGTVLD